MQSGLSVPEMDLHQPESQGPSRKSSIQMQWGPVMGPGVPALRRHSGHPSHQIPLRPSVRSGSQVPIRPLAPSDKYCDKQAGPVAPRKQRKERTMYTKEQKCLLQEQFEQCKYPDVGQRMALALVTGVTEYAIQIRFKNRRAKEHQKKSLQLPGRIGSGPHCRPTSNNGGGVPAFAASPDSVCHRHLDASCPQFRPLRESPHQELNFTLIDQPLEDMCFSNSHVIGEYHGQKCGELPRNPGYLSSDRSGRSNVPSPPDVSASAGAMCERPLGLSCSRLLRRSNITQNSESTFSMYQAPSVASPLPELSPLSHSLDRMAIFPNTDQTCENNTSSKKPQKQKEKAEVQIWKQDWDSCAKPQSPKGTAFLSTSACEDTSCERQSVCRSPPWSPSSTSPDSESIFFAWEGTSRVSSPPPFSPSMFSDPESTISIMQINENLLREALMSGEAD